MVEKGLVQRDVGTAVTGGGARRLGRAFAVIAAGQRGRPRLQHTPEFAQRCDVFLAGLEDITPSLRITSAALGAHHTSQALIRRVNAASLMP